VNVVQSFRPMTDTLEHREFVPGTTGWSVDDLDDPAIEALWNAGKYEIVEGVLTTMPPAYFDSGFALLNLVQLIDAHNKSIGLGGAFAFEVDVVMGRYRLPRVDALYLSAEDQRKQKQAHAKRGRSDLQYGRILVPPTLIIESLSRGHESHDRETKRNWYAEAGVPNYWLLDAAVRSLECLVLDGTAYRADAVGHHDVEIRPALFPGLVIPLGTLWAQ
jgi:Uma2 family endonuclease